MLASQGTREEGYTDPATATQDAMVTRASAGGSCGGFVGQPGAAVLPGGPVAFQVLWEACQQRTGEHKTLLQLMLCNKSYQQLCLGNVLLLYSSSPICSKKQVGNWGEGGVTSRGKPVLSRHLF